MNTFFIARHGKTYNNEAGRLSGWVDTPLTADGLEPTTAVIEKLRPFKFDEIYSSDLGRAFITAYAIARSLGYTKEIIRVPEFREVNYGDAAHMKSVEAYKLYPRLDRDTHYLPPNGETLAAMQARALGKINEINDAHTDKTFLIVAHSGVMAALNASKQGIDFGEHNISEAYAHDYVARFTVAAGDIATFDAVI